MDYIKITGFRQEKRKQCFALIPKTQRVIRVFSVTTGDMLQRNAAYMQLWSELTSDPGYGDLCAKDEHDPMRVEQYVRDC
jgi:hypothetical protein